MCSDIPLEADDIGTRSNEPLSTDVSIDVGDLITVPAETSSREVDDSSGLSGSNSASAGRQSNPRCNSGSSKADQWHASKSSMDDLVPPRKVLRTGIPLKRRGTGTSDLGASARETSAKSSRAGDRFCNLVDTADTVNQSPDDLSTFTNVGKRRGEDSSVASASTGGIMCSDIPLEADDIGTRSNEPLSTDVSLDVGEFITFPAETSSREVDDSSGLSGSNSASAGRQSNPRCNSEFSKADQWHASRSSMDVETDALPREAAADKVDQSLDDCSDESSSAHEAAVDTVNQSSDDSWDNSSDKSSDESLDNCPDKSSLAREAAPNTVDKSSDYRSDESSSSRKAAADIVDERSDVFLDDRLDVCSNDCSNDALPRKAAADKVDQSLDDCSDESSSAHEAAVDTVNQSSDDSWDNSSDKSSDESLDNCPDKSSLAREAAPNTVDKSSDYRSDESSSSRKAAADIVDERSDVFLDDRSDVCSNDCSNNISAFKSANSIGGGTASSSPTDGHSDGEGTGGRADESSLAREAAADAVDESPDESSDDCSNNISAFKTGKMRTQQFMSDSLCQQKLMELQHLLEALLNVRSTRESTRDPGAKKASLAKFCKGCTHQHVFGCEVGVLPAVPRENVKETRWLDGQASQVLTSALREGWETWWVDGDGNCFWRSLSLSIWRSQRFYRQIKLAVLAYASEKSETLVSEGHHLHDNITYYDASVVQKFKGAATATRHECMLLAELAPLCSDGSWAGRITSYLASEALGCIVKFIHPVDKNARAKQDASAISCGSGRKGLNFGDNRWSKTYVPTGTHTVLRVRGTDDREDTFVEEATVTFTKCVLEHRVSTLSELEALKIAEIGEATDIKDLNHFAAIIPKDGNSRPFPVYLAAPPLYMCKDKEAERLYVAELSRYTNSSMARKGVRHKARAAAARQRAEEEAAAAARQRVEAAEAEVRKQAQAPVVEAKAKAAARQQALMEAATAAARQRAEAVEAAEAEARQQAVVAEAKAKAAALHQAWMKAATTEARQQAWAKAAAEEAAAAAASWQQAEAEVEAATAEHLRIAELTRARMKLTAKVRFHSDSLGHGRAR